MKNISVIMNTVKEDPLVLQRAINSYLNQQGVTLQLIISTVEGDACINQFEGVEYSVLPKSQHSGKSPKGAYEQINHALKMVKGDWLCYASGNDYAHEKKLITEVELCLSSGKEVCYSAFFSQTNGVNTLMKFRPEYDYSAHFEGNFVSDCSLISRRLVEKYLPYDLDLKNYAHWDSWLRIYEGEGDVFVYNPEPTWFYVQNHNDMHNIRKRSPEQIEQAKKDREFMLSRHR